MNKGLFLRKIALASQWDRQCSMDQSSSDSTCYIHRHNISIGVTPPTKNPLHGLLVEKTGEVNLISGNRALEDECYSPFTYIVLVCTLKLFESVSKPFLC